MFHRVFASLFVMAAGLVCIASVARAQAPPQPIEETSQPPLTRLNDLPGLNSGLNDLLANSGGPANNREPATFSAQYQLVEGTNEGRVTLTVDLADEWHVYSLTQPAGGPMASRIKLADGQSTQLTGPFQPHQPPQVHRVPEYDVPVEEHAGQVSWSAPIQLDQGVDPQTTTLTLVYNGQVCSDACIPIFNREVAATFAGYLPKPAAGGTYREADAHVELMGTLQPQTVQPGGIATLTIAARPDEKWHVYALAEQDPKQISKPTVIALTNLSGLQPSATVASETPVEKETGLDEEPILYYHEQPVAWTIKLQIPSTAEAGDYQIEGLIGYQTCTEVSCDNPKAASFVGTVRVGDKTVEGEQSLAFTSASYDEANEAAIRYAAVPKTGGATKPLDTRELLTAIGFGLIGGLLLNLMPCVLPVIGLKILSFVEQGGQSRAHVFMLNLWYSLGLLAVFAILATLAAFVNLGWGEQFTHLWFKVAMTVLVFSMALSFLGTWEIPIPGFVGAGKSNELQQREGMSGAFFKGMFTTVLATPCSGPFLGPVFGYTLAQPPVVTYVVFLSVGLGMASPYLVIGAFPGLMRFLPKPGMWMETFKQLMAFFLLGTVVYLFTTISDEYFIAVLALLVGVWFACWWIGRTPITAETSKKAMNWAGAVGLAVLIGFGSFEYLGPREELIPWEPYSPTALREATNSGKTVMVDFTADWCPTCKLNLARAIDTHPVNEVVQKHNVVPLIADWSDRSDTIKQALNELNSNSIPVLAIYPAGKPDQVIVLRDLLSQDDVLEALQQAGPSLEGAGETTTAMGEPVESSY